MSPLYVYRIDWGGMAGANLYIISGIAPLTNGKIVHQSSHKSLKQNGKFRSFPFYWWIQYGFKIDWGVETEIEN